MNRDGGRWVHLYEFGIGGTAAAAAWDRLPAEARARAERIADPVRQARFVNRRAALRDIVDGYPAGVCFNSSHSGDRAAVAVAGCPVGVDVEVDAPRRGLDRIERRMFSADERSALAGTGARERRRIFYRCWVAKEAYAKGLGRGLALRFDGFSVASALRSPDGTGPVGDGWTVSIRTGEDCHLAVAYAAGAVEVMEVRHG